MNGEYLGDGLYVEHDGQGVWLRAPREHGAVHSVYLEPEVFRSLCAYWQRTFKSEQRDSRTARDNNADASE